LINGLPFRQIHMDFHTSEAIEKIGAEFDAEEFASTLKNAHVESVTCFARCHHGWMYYDSKKFPERVHPNLVNKNLLKEQIEACHRYGIRVPIYITVQFDVYTCKEHPEWLVLDEKGNPRGTPVFEPGFYRQLCLNSPYRDLIKEMTAEVLETFDADGLFFDIVGARDCSCKYCIESMEKLGLDPVVRENRMKYAYNLVNDFVLDMTAFVRKYNKRCSIYYNSGSVGPANKGGIKAFTHLEFDSLPSQWADGYKNLIVQPRYERNLGLECVGQTGKFHRTWGDFHTFKNKAALEYECFLLLALGCKCMIGDQLHPSGKIDSNVYSLIGSVYSQVEEKEPWCKNVKPLTDIGVLNPGEYGKEHGSLYGIAQMLKEGGQQFDIIDSGSDFTQYKVIILPDRIPVNSELNDKIENYLAGGGSLIASFESGMNTEGNEIVLKSLGVKLKGTGPIAPDGKPARGRIFNNVLCASEYTDYILPRRDIAKGLFETEYAMYAKCLEVDALDGTSILADVISPYFYRTYKHFCSHGQTPSSGKIDSAGIVRNGNTIYFAHAIFDLYHLYAPLWCKKLFLNALDILLPAPLLRHNGPSTLQTAVNEQPSKNRWVVHLLHYVPERRAKYIDVIEDAIPIYGLEVSLRACDKVEDILMVPGGKSLEFVQNDARVNFTVPEVKGHQMIEIRFAAEQ
jgi:hypothetical protein